jgi:hypothetical protein
MKVERYGHILLFFRKVVLKVCRTIHSSSFGHASIYPLILQIFVYEWTETGIKICSPFVCV